MTRQEMGGGRRAGESERAGTAGEVIELREQKDLKHLLTLRYRGPCARTGEGLPGHKGGPNLHTAREWKGAAQSYNHKEQDSAYHLNEAKSEFFLKPPHRSPTSRHLDFLHNPEQRNQSSQHGLLTHRTMT